MHRRHAIICQQHFRICKQPWVACALTLSPLVHGSASGGDGGGGGGPGGRFRMRSETYTSTVSHDFPQLQQHNANRASRWRQAEDLPLCRPQGCPNPEGWWRCSVFAWRPSRQPSAWSWCSVLGAWCFVPRRGHGAGCERVGAEFARKTRMHYPVSRAPEPPPQQQHRHEADQEEHAPAPPVGRDPPAFSLGLRRVAALLQRLQLQLPRWPRPCISPSPSS